MFDDGFCLCVCTVCDVHENGQLSMKSTNFCPIDHWKSSRNRLFCLQDDVMVENYSKDGPKVEI